MDFLKDQLEITGTNKADGFLKSTGAGGGLLHPLAIGRVFRIQRLVNELSERMLAMHMPAEQEAERKQIVRTLVTELRAHEHRIGRQEARRIGLPAVDASGDLEKLMWKLFVEYEEAMQLRVPITAETSFVGDESVAVLEKCKMVYLESRVRTDVFETDVVLQRYQVQVSPQLAASPRPTWGPQINVSVEKSSWKTE